MDVMKELSGAAKNPYMDNTCKLSVVVVNKAADEIERLQGQVKKLEEEVYLLSSDLTYIHVKIGDKPDENSR